MRISDWSSDVCSSDLNAPPHPLPSQGREQERAAEAAPTKARGFESSTAVPLDGEHMLHARLALEHGHPLTRHPQARLVQHAQARQVARVGGGDDRFNRRVAPPQRPQRLNGLPPPPPPLPPWHDSNPEFSDPQVGAPVETHI